LVRSPDGSQVAFWFDEGWAVPESRVVEQALYAVDADGSRPRRLVGPLPGQNGSLAWSADGRAIYYVSTDRYDGIEPQPWRIHRVDVATGQEEVASEIVARRLNLLSQERDGKLLLEILNDDLVFAVHILDLATGEMENGPAAVNVLGWLD
jgi:dipeptidyl aminopeptidase/acylaminoacyl peptidase